MTAVDDSAAFFEALDPPSHHRPGDFERDARGLPYVVDVDDPTRRVRYGRPSSLGKRVENTYNLTRWSERQVLFGCALSPGVSTAALELADGDQRDKAWRETADRLVVAAKEAAGAHVAAKRGTVVHELTERDDEGRSLIDRLEAADVLGVDGDVADALLRAWRMMLDDAGLEVVAVEQTVVNDRHRTAGTLDRLVRTTRDLSFCPYGENVTIAAGETLVLDLKTGRLSIDRRGRIEHWSSYAVQVALYASSVGYDVETDRRFALPEPPSTEWALIAHLPVGEALDGDVARCRLVLVDVRRGLAAAELCDAVGAWQANAWQSFTVEREYSTPIAGRVSQIEQQMTATLRDVLQRRIDAVKAYDADAALWLANALRTLGIPTLKQSTEHTADDLSKMTAVIVEAEARAVLPWTDDDLGRTPTPIDEPVPVVTVSQPAQRLALPDRSTLDDDTPETSDRLASLKALYETIDDDGRAWIGGRVDEATRAGYPMALMPNPRARRCAIVRALVAAWRWNARTAGEWDALASDVARDLLDDVTGERWSPSIPLGALFGALTVEQARAVLDAFDNRKENDHVG